MILKDCCKEESKASSSSSGSSSASPEAFGSVWRSLLSRWGIGTAGEWGADENPRILLCILRCARRMAPHTVLQVRVSLALRWGALVWRGSEGREELFRELSLNQDFRESSITGDGKGESDERVLSILAAFSV